MYELQDAHQARQKEIDQLVAALELIEVNDTGKCRKNDSEEWRVDYGYDAIIARKALAKYRGAHDAE